MKIIANQFGRVGLEISEGKIEFAVAGRRNKQWRLIQQGALNASPENMAHALHSLRREISGNIRDTVLGVPYHQVLIKEIRVDSALTPSEINQYIKQQAPLFFGKTADDWFFDFEPLSSSDSSAQMLLRVVAAPRALLLHWMSLCREAGFNVRAIDVDALALTRILPQLTDYFPEKPQALIRKKNSELLFIAAHQGRFVYAKRAAILPGQSLINTLPPLVQFFYGLYPQLTLANALVVAEDLKFKNTVIPFPSRNDLPLKTATLSETVWETSTPVQSSAIGLCIHGDQKFSGLSSREFLSCFDAALGKADARAKGGESRFSPFRIPHRVRNLKQLLAFIANKLRGFLHGD